MDALNTFHDMYVCTNYIRNEQKLRLQVARPNYNLRDLEHANVVLSVSVHINEAADEGAIPKYRNFESSLFFVMVYRPIGFLYFKLNWSLIFSQTIQYNGPSFFNIFQSSLTLFIAEMYNLTKYKDPAIWLPGKSISNYVYKIDELVK